MKEVYPPPQPPIRPGLGMPDLDAPLVERALTQFKVEVAGDMGLPPGHRPAYRGHMAAREAGRMGGPIGGEMVRRMIIEAEKEMADKTPPSL